MRCDFGIFPGAILYVFLHLFMPLPQDLKKPLRVLVTICHTVFSIQKSNLPKCFCVSKFVVYV